MQQANIRDQVAPSTTDGASFATMFHHQAVVLNPSLLVFSSFVYNTDHSLHGKVLLSTAAKVFSQSASKKLRTLRFLLNELFKECLLLFEATSKAEIF